MLREIFEELIASIVVGILLLLIYKANRALASGDTDIVKI